MHHTESETSVIRYLQYHSGKVGPLESNLARKDQLCLNVITLSVSCAAFGGAVVGFEPESGMTSEIP